MYFFLYSFAVFVFATLIPIAIYAMRNRKRERQAFKKGNCEKSALAKGGTQWNNHEQEYRVEQFYETGLTGKHDFHGGYLNFGFWEDGNDDYIKASETLLSRVADAIGLNEESRLLDVANGMGAQDIFFLKKYNPKHIDMIDVTLTHHLICKKLVEENGLEDKLAAHYGSAVNLPFNDESFSHVFSIEGGPHYQTRNAFLKEAYRVLEPNGMISQADFAMPLGSVSNSRPQNVIESVLRWLCAFMWNMPKANYCTCQELRQNMLDVGFVDVVVEDVGKQCIPGYYKESVRPETLRELSKIRGWFNTYVLGRIIDELILYCYQKGHVTEVIAYGRKPALEIL